jgi:hypothetical protein
MARRSHASRLSDIVMDELAGEQTWDLDKHLSGCLVGYQTDQSYGAAVYFALEALSGIAHDVAVRANAGKLDADQLDTNWIISPDTNLPVPWTGGPGNGSALLSGSVIQNDRNFPEVVTQRAAHAKA